MQQSFRFIGIRPYETSEKKTFFERDENSTELIKHVDNHNITIFHSKPGTGKTSLLKAKIIPEYNKQKNTECFYVSFDNAIKNTNNNLLSQIINVLNTNNNQQTSFLDKIIKPENTLWYKLKRIEGTNNIKIIIILDQFENIFSYPETQIAELKKNITETITTQIPERYRNKINENFKLNPKILTNTGKEKLYKNINVKFIISIRTDKIQQLNYFENKLNFNNKFLLEPITQNQAKNIIGKISSFVHKYNIDNNFISKPFKISDELINKITNFLSENPKKEIEIYQLQIIGREIEKIAVKKNITKIGTKNITNFDTIYKDYYESIIEQIPENTQEISARKFIENELFFEYEHRKLTIYEGIAAKKYKLTNKTLKFLIKKHIIKEITNNLNEKYYEISHDALLTPISLAKNKRIKHEIEIEAKLKKYKEIKEQNKLQQQKIKRNRNFILIVLSLLIFSISMAITAIFNKNQAEKNKIFAESNLFASYAANYINSDPTISLRLAQKAYEIDKNNLSKSALLKAFFKTNVFYEIIDTLNYNFNNATLSKDGKLIALTNNDPDNKQIIVLNINAKKILHLKNLKTIGVVKFNKNSSKILITNIIDGTAYIYNIKTNKLISEIKHKNGLLLYANFHPNDDKIITCGTNKTAKIWSENGKLLKTLSKHTHAVEYAGIAPEKNLIATIDAGNSVYVWNENNEKIAVFNYKNNVKGQNAIVSCANFSNDASKILIVINNKISNFYQIKIWDWKKNQIIKELKFFDKWINSAKFINKNEIIAFTKNGKAYITNISNNNTKILIGHSNEIFDITYKNNNSFLSISKDKTIRNWKIFSQKNLFDKFKNNSIVKYSNTGKYVAIVNSKITIINLLGEIVSEKNIGKIKNVNFSEKDNFIITISDSSASLINIEQNKNINFYCNDKIINSSFNNKNSDFFICTNNHIINYNINGKIISKKKIKIKCNTSLMTEKNIFAADKNKVDIFNIKGEIINSIKLKNINLIKSNKYKIIIANSKNIYIYNKKFSLENKISSQNKITAINISKKSTNIAYGDNSGNCYLLDKNGKEMFNFKMNGKIINICFAPNEKTILINHENPLSMKSELNSFIISPNEIIKHIDKLKLYGNVQKLSETNFKNLYETYLKKTL